MRHRKLTDRTPLGQANVHMMIQRRARGAGIKTKISCHSFRATGITTYLQNGGKLEVAQQMAGHESARTTGLYDAVTMRSNATRSRRSCILSTGKRGQTQNTGSPSPLWRVPGQILYAKGRPAFVSSSFCLGREPSLQDLQQAVEMVSEEE